MQEISRNGVKVAVPSRRRPTATCPVGDPDDVHVDVNDDVHDDVNDDVHD